MLDSAIEKLAALNLISTSNKSIKKLLKKWPWLFWRLKFWKQRVSIKHEKEMLLLPILANQQYDSIDVGASSGLYSLALVPLSRKVIAFEPRTNAVQDLIEITQALKLPIEIKIFALSNQAGEAEMRMLKHDLGRSTIAQENTLMDPDGSPINIALVQTKTLDSFFFSKIGFIKIDVEGHEMSVLEGARQTIANNRCNLLLEMEERHCPGVILHAKKWMKEKGYVGFFFEENRLMDIELFDPVLSQNPENIGGWKEKWRLKGKYINNFIFVPSENKREFLKKLRSRGFGHAF